jgi:hypothetical protein
MQQILIPEQHYASKPGRPVCDECSALSVGEPYPCLQKVWPSFLVMPHWRGLVEGIAVACVKAVLILEKGVDSGTVQT